MGESHAISTTAIALGTAAALAAVIGHSFDTAWAIIAFGFVAGGFGVLPDLDHPSATLSRVLGPVTHAIAEGVNTVSGGHRKGTHTVWFAAGMTALVWFLDGRFGIWAQAPTIFVGLFLAFMLMRLSPRHGQGTSELVYAAEAAVATWAVLQFLPDPWWVPLAVGVGCVGHIIGDVITTAGVPILYPLFPNFKVRLPILGDTDSTREHVFAALCGVVVVWMILAVATGNNWWTFGWFLHPSTWQMAL